MFSYVQLQGKTKVILCIYFISVCPSLKFNSMVSILKKHYQSIMVLKINIMSASSSFSRFVNFIVHQVDVNTSALNLFSLPHVNTSLITENGIHLCKSFIFNLLKWQSVEECIIFKHFSRSSHVEGLLIQELMNLSFQGIKASIRF